MCDWHRMTQACNRRTEKRNRIAAANLKQKKQKIIHYILLRVVDDITFAVRPARRLVQPDSFRHRKRLARQFKLKSNDTKTERPFRLPASPICRRPTDQAAQADPGDSDSTTNELLDIISPTEINWNFALMPARRPLSAAAQTRLASPPTPVSRASLSHNSSFVSRYRTNAQFEQTGRFILCTRSSTCPRADCTQTLHDRRQHGPISSRTKQNNEKNRVFVPVTRSLRTSFFGNVSHAHLHHNNIDQPIIVVKIDQTDHTSRPYHPQKVRAK